jgi:carbonic anhydrase
MPNQEHSPQVPESTRRGFLHTAAAAATVGVATCCRSASAADPELVLPLTKAARDALTPDQIIARAKAGNDRFRTGKLQHRDFLVELQKTADGQSPASVVLGCIDSRAPAEIIFDLGLGDIFSCRVAGCVESPDVLGSMEFATKVSGAKVITVLGHSACGAVKGAIANVELGNLTQLLAKIRPAVEQTEYKGSRTADNLEFVDLVARKNIELTVQRIRQSSPIIAGLEQSKAVKIIGCFYNLATGAVEFII